MQPPKKINTKGASFVRGYTKLCNEPQQTTTS